MEKNNTLEQFIDFIEKSWTYEKMTPKEKANLMKVFYSAETKNALKYRSTHKWDILHAIYNSYVLGLGYDGFDWRS